MKRFVEAIKDCGNLAILAADYPDAVLHNAAIRALRSLGKACDAMKETPNAGHSSCACSCKKSGCGVLSDKGGGGTAP